MTPPKPMLLTEADLIEEIKFLSQPLEKVHEVQPCDPCVDVEVVDDDDSGVTFQDELRKTLLLLRKVDSLFFILPMQELKKTLTAQTWWEVLRIEKEIRDYLGEWEFQEGEEA